MSSLKSVKFYFSREDFADVLGVDVEQVLVHNVKTSPSEGSIEIQLVLDSTSTVKDFEVSELKNESGLFYNLRRQKLLNSSNEIDILSELANRHRYELVKK